MSTKHLPPDDELEALGRTITARLNESGRVNFFGEVEEGAPAESVTYLIIFQAGARRRVVKLRRRPTAADVEALVTAHREWTPAVAVRDLYTDDPPETRWPEFV